MASAARRPNCWRKLGAKVVISSRKADACEVVADGIRNAGGDAHVIPCNISRRAEVDGIDRRQRHDQHYGKVDILVCNAAVNPYYGPLLDITDEAFDKIMGSNVKSNIWLCAQAIPQMAERGNGSVVIVSSIGGLRGSPVIGAYGISKAADFSLCRSLAGEWGPKGVRVNCVAPGLVKTDFARALVGRRGAPEAPLRHHAAAPDRRARRNRRRRRLSRVRRLDLHDRPDHRGRRRRDDRVGVDSFFPSPLVGEGGVAKRRRMRGRNFNVRRCYPHPSRRSLRSHRRSTLSHKGRGEEAAAAALYRRA